jgi:hypothetical protein
MRNRNLRLKKSRALSPNWKKPNAKLRKPLKPGIQNRRNKNHHPNQKEPSPKPTLPY